MTEAPMFDLYSQASKNNPHPIFAALREHAPVFRQVGIDRKTPVWFVTGYDEADKVLRDDQHFVQDPRHALSPVEMERFGPRNPLLDLIDNHMLAKDWGDHRRLRGLVSKAFTPQMIEGLRGRVQQIADHLLDEVVAQGQMDLVEAFAFPFPITVIAELLGIPAADRDKFRRWSNTFVSLQVAREDVLALMAEMEQFTGYLRELFAQRRKEPRNDLISALLAVEEAGDRLNEGELFSMVVLLIVAGHETTVSLIGNAVLTLLNHPEQMALLREQPDLIPQALEEVLRYEGPVERAILRWVAADVELGGQQLRRGELVSVVLAAADRDPAHFPQDFDVTRPSARHLAFGRGVHYCLGAPLARLEGDVALRTLLRRLPNLRRQNPAEELQWRVFPIFRGLVSLPLAWDA